MQHYVLLYNGVYFVETVTQHFLTTCDFLLRLFTFQKKILPHIYEQRRLPVSKKFFFFSKINHVFLQTYSQCNSLKIQTSIQYQSHLPTVHQNQNQVSTVKFGDRLKAVFDSGFPVLSYGRQRIDWGSQRGSKLPS